MATNQNQTGRLTAEEKSRTLGAVDTDGTARFAGDINACRQFLRGLGLECERLGWEGNGMLGSIEFHEGQYHAQAWKSDLAKPNEAEAGTPICLHCIGAGGPHLLGGRGIPRLDHDEQGSEP